MFTLLDLDPNAKRTQRRSAEQQFAERRQAQIERRKEQLARGKDKKQDVGFGSTLLRSGESRFLSSLGLKSNIVNNNNRPCRRAETQSMRGAACDGIDAPAGSPLHAVRFRRDAAEASSDEGSQMDGETSDGSSTSNEGELRPHSSVVVDNSTSNDLEDGG